MTTSESASPTTSTPSQKLAVANSTLPMRRLNASTSRCFGLLALHQHRLRQLRREQRVHPLHHAVAGEQEKRAPVGDATSSCMRAAAASTNAGSFGSGRSRGT